MPRWSGVIDHVEIRSDDAGPLADFETAKQVAFPLWSGGAVLSLAEVERMVLDWLDHEAKGAAWQTWLSTSRQLSLFEAGFCVWFAGRRKGAGDDPCVPYSQ